MFFLPLGGVTIALIIIGFIVGGLLTSGLIIPVIAGLLLGLLWTNSPGIFYSLVIVAVAVVVLYYLGLPVLVSLAEKTGIEGSNKDSLLTKIYDKTRAITGWAWFLGLVVLAIEFVIEITREVNHEYPKASMLFDIVPWFFYVFGVGLVLTAILYFLVKKNTPAPSDEPTSHHSS